MRIISKEQDYYDGVANSLSGGHGDLVFNRQPRLVELSKVPQGIGSLVSTIDRISGCFDCATVYGVRINFCGQVYQGIKIHFGPAGSKLSTKYYFDEKKLYSSVLEYVMNEPKISYYVEKSSEVRKRLSKKDIDEFKRLWDQRFDNQNKRVYQRFGMYLMKEPVSDVIGFRREDHKSCIEYKTPVHAVLVSASSSDYRTYFYSPATEFDGEPNRFGTRGKFKITADSAVGQFDFQSVYDPYTAVQELEMYIGNQLALERETPVTVSDDIKVQTHGFDSDYGFRTRPGTKKPRH